MVMSQVGSVNSDCFVQQLVTTLMLLRRRPRCSLGQCYQTPLKSYRHCEMCDTTSQGTSTTGARIPVRSRHSDVRENTADGTRKKENTTGVGRIRPSSMNTSSRTSACHPSRGHDRHGMNDSSRCMIVRQDARFQNVLSEAELNSKSLS